MTELIDQDSPEHVSNWELKKKRIFNLLPPLLICLSFGIVAYTIITVRHDVLYPVSPWLPEYTPYYIHSLLINFCVLQFIGIVPALYLRWKKKYALSSYFMFGFIVVAKIFQNHVEFYKTIFTIFH